MPQHSKPVSVKFGDISKFDPTAANNDTIYFISDETHPEEPGKIYVGSMCFSGVDPRVFDNYYTKAETNEAISVSLTDYYTASEVVTLLSNYVTLSNLTSVLAGYYTKHDVDQLLSQYYTAAEVDAQIALALSDYYTSSEVDDKISTALEDCVTETELLEDLENYYTKSQTYSQAEINELLDYVPVAIDSFSVKCNPTTNPPTSNEFEYGSTVTSVTWNFTLNKSPQLIESIDLYYSSSEISGHLSIDPLGSYSGTIEGLQVTRIAGFNLVVYEKPVGPHHAVITKRVSITPYHYVYTQATSSSVIPTSAQGMTRQSSNFSSAGATIYYTAGDYLWFMVQHDPGLMYYPRIQTYVLGQWADVDDYEVYWNQRFEQSNGVTDYYTACRLPAFIESGSAVYRLI